MLRFIYSVTLVIANFIAVLFMDFNAYDYITNSPLNIGTEGEIFILICIINFLAILDDCTKHKAQRVFSIIVSLIPSIWFVCSCIGWHSKGYEKVSMITANSVIRLLVVFVSFSIPLILLLHMLFCKKKAAKLQ